MHTTSPLARVRRPALSACALSGLLAACSGSSTDRAHEASTGEVSAHDDAGATRDAGLRDGGGHSPRDGGTVLTSDASTGQRRDGGDDAALSDAGVPGRRLPNIVLVVADDLGFSDLGSFGGEIETPNLDALAAFGLRFTNVFNSSRCSPSRASLLTGQYPHRVGLGANGHDLSRNALTIAEVLRGAGYRTAMAGKWHLSETPELSDGRHMDWLNHQYDPGLPFSPKLESYPVGRGFEQHYGPIWGVVDYFDPFSLVENLTAVASVPSGFYMTQAIGDKTVQYVEELADGDAPFFLYVAHTAPHWPLHALPEDIAKYDGRYDDGWHVIRNARYQRQVELGLFAPSNAPLSPTTGLDWGGLSDDKKRFLANVMETHAAMVDRLDQTVGTLVRALERKGALDDTLIVFMSDNGASPEIYLQAGFDRPSQTRDKRPIVACGGQHPCSYVQPGSETTWTYLGPSWANMANTPFRFAKASSFRGGNNTPVIIHWPRGLRKPAGTISEEPAHVVDILPTLLDVVGVDYPANDMGQALTALDGRSLKPLLEDAPLEPRAPMYFEHEGGAAVISGRHKVVRQGSNAPWELYDLAVDRTETRDLAVEQPLLRDELVADWQRWFDSL